MTTLVLQPAELVQKLIQIAKDKKTTPEALLSVAVKEYVVKEEQPLTAEQQVDKPDRNSFDAAFDREVENFERMKSELLLHYPNRAVAIYQGQVIEIGDDILQVHNTVVNKYGSIPCYVQLVSEEPPRTVRIPSAWITR